MSSLRVLHIDDDPDILDIVSISLGLDPEIVVRGCHSGADGLAAAAIWQPDLVLLDVMMPVLDGPATLGHLRKIHRTATLPIVFMTARAQTREVNYFKSLGAAGVISKPFNPIELAPAVRSYIQLVNGG
jgi:CheY-like chemotaxis protein